VKRVTRYLEIDEVLDCRCDHFTILGIANL